MVASRLMPSIDALIDSPPPESTALTRFAELPDRLLPRPDAFDRGPPATASREPRRRSLRPGHVLEAERFVALRSGDRHAARVPASIRPVAASCTSTARSRQASSAASGGKGMASDQQRLVVRRTVEWLLHRHDDDVVRRRTFLHSGRSRPRFGVPPLSDYPRGLSTRCCGRTGSATASPSSGGGPRIRTSRRWSISSVPTWLSPTSSTTTGPGINRAILDGCRVEADYRAAVARSEIVLANCAPVVEAVEELTGRRPALTSPTVSSSRIVDRRGRGPESSRRCPLGRRSPTPATCRLDLDLELLDGLVRRRPEWQFALMGSAHLDRAALRLDEHPERSLPRGPPVSPS